MSSLPGTPGPTLSGVWEELSPEVREALADHLLGDTSAEWLSSTLTTHGHRISATTIRTYRRSVRLIGEMQ